MSLVRRSILLLILLALASPLFFLGHRYMNLTFLKAQMSVLLALHHEHAFFFTAAFFFLYVAVAALSVPGAAMMTLAAGALFGLIQGTLLASLASSLGALLAFLGSRYLLRDYIERRYAERMRNIDQGLEREGAFYLLTLRLLPLFPFFLVNVLLGLTRMRSGTFYMLSQLGMLPGTLVYVNAGTQLAHISKPTDILSLRILGAFALLALFPWIARMILDPWRAYRALRGWARPQHYDRNLIVIGAGAAGLVSAYIAAAVKAKVTLIENHRMGGDCLNYGCVPSKALIRSAKLAHQIRHADRYGLRPTSAIFSFQEVMQRVQSVIQQVAPHDSSERYTALGVEVLQGHARLVDPWTVEIKDTEGHIQRLTTRAIILATGASPSVPDLPGLEDAGYLTSDTLWEELARREKIPARLVVLGGGPIGCELTQAMARLGAKVTQVERSDRLMAREDVDVSALVLSALQNEGVTVLTGHEALRCERMDGRKFLVLEHGGQNQRIEFDDLICAVGRTARLKGYGLEDLGIPTGKTITTNEYLQTSFPHILAAGDVAGPYQLTHTAAHQAWYASVNALFGFVHKFKVDYRVIPWTTFVDPEVARVGLNEQEAKAQGIRYELTHYGIDDLDRAMADGSAYGFIKILTVPGKDKILGVTLVGEHAGDLLAEFVLAMKWGLGLNKILATLHTYPTLSEANKYAAGAWKRAHTPQALLRWLERLHHWRRGN